MKKFLVFFLAMMLVFTAVASAKKKVVEMDDNEEEVTVVENVVNTNVLQWLGLQFNVGYERKLASSLSIKVHGNYWGLSSNGFNLWGIGGDVFFYPGGKAPGGFYIRPHVDYWALSHEDGSISQIWLGFQGGHQWIFGGGFAMGVGLGGMTNLSTTVSYKDQSVSLSAPISGFLPTVDFNLGFGF